MMGWYINIPASVVAGMTKALYFVNVFITVFFVNYS